MSPDPALRERAIIIEMAHTLVRLHSPLDESFGSLLEARFDLLDAGYGTAAVDRHFKAARESAGRLQ